MKICVRILQANDNQVCVEFVKQSGDQFRFHEHFNEFKNSVLQSMNDTLISA